jgi:hypothetical protein
MSTKKRKNAGEEPVGQDAVNQAQAPDAEAADEAPKSRRQMFVWLGAGAAIALVLTPLALRYAHSEPKVHVRKGAGY